MALRTFPASLAVLPALLCLLLGACGGGGGSANNPLPPAQPARLEMLVGTVPTGPGDVDGFGTSARFRGPNGIAIDAAGVIYVADSENFVVRRITPDGLVRTWAGASGEAGFADGAGSAARFGGGPSIDGAQGIGGMAFDASGNLLVADRGNHRIRRVTSQAAVSTVAGDGVQGFADGAATAARFDRPWAIAVDRLGNAYVAEAGRSWIRKVTPAGAVTTVAGAAESGAADGPAASARFGFITGLAVDGAGNVYVADFPNHAIRRLGTDGIVTTIAGQLGVAGAADGRGTQALLNGPAAIAIDAGGTLYVKDSRSIRRIQPSGDVTTVAALATDAIGGLAVAATGEIYATAYADNTVLRIAPGGAVTVVAGAQRETIARVDGNAMTARFTNLTAMTVNAQGELLVIDNDSIRKVSSRGDVSTVASGFANFGIAGIATDEQGAVYFATWNYCGLRPNPGCTNHSVIHKLHPGGQVTDVLPLGSSDGTSLVFRRIGALARDGAGNLLVADQDPGRVLRMDAAGDLTTVSAALNAPLGLAVDASGSVYVTDGSRRTLTRIAPDGASTTLLTTPPAPPGTLLGPRAVAVDNAGRAYVADTGNQVVTEVDASGTIIGAIGQQGRQGFIPDLLPAFLDTPVAVAVYGDTLYIAMPTAIAVVRGRP
jgi:sugar lactone lactonase YvrE